MVRTWHTYFVNGYRFDTDSWSEGKSTKNSGVCTRGTVYGQAEDDYYGILQEVIQLEYPGLPLKRLVLFNCKWFDPTLGRGTRIHDQFGIVEVRSTRWYNQYDPFILASQAHQVYYAPYPSRHRNLVDWWVVIRIKARSVIDAPTVESTVHAYQEDEEMPLQLTTVGDEHIPSLRDNDGIAEEVQVDNINDTFIVEDGNEDTDDQADDEEDTDDEEEDIDELIDDESEYEFE